MSKYQKLCIEHGWFGRGNNEQFDYCINMSEELIVLKYKGNPTAFRRCLDMLVELTYVFTFGGEDKGKIRQILKEEYM